MRAAKARIWTRVHGGLRWGWFVGLVPVSFTWFLTESALESAWAPAGLVLLFLAGSVSQDLLEESARAAVPLTLMLMGVFWSAGWGLSLVLE